MEKMHKYRGAIIAHIGPMFGGKTSALLSDVRKMNIAKYNVALFKPTKDIRYSEDAVVNHDGARMEAIRLSTFAEIVAYVNTHPEINVIAIDEFQFIKGDVFNVSHFIGYILESGKTLIISGLDLDSDLIAFNNIKELLPYATHINKHKAVCVCCGNDATTSYCKVKKEEQELIGEKDIYEPKCLKCYFNKVS